MSTGRRRSRASRLVACALGIVGSLIMYGLLQERIMTRPYAGESFKFSVFLVLSNRLLSASLALLILLYKQNGIRLAAPIWKYSGVSVSNVLAAACQYEALKYVSFPVQTLVKCAKMIPVMVWGHIINEKRYKISDYVISLIVTFGCTIFALFRGATDKHDATSATNMKGVLLMLGYLGFDGFTSTFQDKLFKSYQMETYNQLLYVNIMSATFSLFWLLADGSITRATDFICHHPAAFKDIVILSLSSTCGQLCILYTIKEYGALLFATIMTTRQLLSILLSCLFFFHPLEWQQWIGVVIVFSALYTKSFLTW